MKLIIAITGASGVIYAKRLIEELNRRNAEIHLVISCTAERIIEHELNMKKEEIEKLANYTYNVNDWRAPIISGSFKTDGMVIAPCSMKTLAGIAYGYSDNIILRAADVMLKERRKLILMPRETPLSINHLRNMLWLAKQGVYIVPAMPAFYHKPNDINDLVNYIVGKILDILDIEHNLYKRWSLNILNNNYRHQPESIQS
ncbi:MAG: UbiX family flavin prenyltransferase [Candidatus Methanomethylicia archaeon]